MDSLAHGLAVPADSEAPALVTTEAKVQRLNSRGEVVPSNELEMVKPAIAGSDPEVPPDATATSHAHEGRRVLHVLFKTISATLYELDFASNIYVAIQYYNFDYGGGNFEGIPGRNNIYASIHAVFHPRGAFIGMCCLMIVLHISCFVFFMVVGLPGEESPTQLRSRLCRACGSYFLPLVQFKRALEGFKFSHGCPCNANTHFLKPTPREEKRAKSHQDIARVEALYAIASATTDGGPLFLYQYLALSVYSTAVAETFDIIPDIIITWKPKSLLIVSLCLSAMSATWNVTRAILFLLPSRSKWLALAAGVFTFTALSIRRTSLVSLLVIETTFTLITLPTVYLLLIVVVPWLGYCWISWKSSSELTFKALSFRAKLNHMLRAAAFTWVSFPFGPLYPILSAAQTTTKGVPTTRFQIRVTLYATFRWLVELSLMTFLIAHHWSPCHIILWGYYNVGYSPCPMMPCPLYIGALAAAFPAAILSQAVFLKLVPTQVTDTSKVEHEEGKIVPATDGTFDVARTTLEIVAFC